MTYLECAVLSGRFSAQEGSMAAEVKITRMDPTAAELRVLASKSRGLAQSRRLLAIAMVLEGGAGRMPPVRLAWTGTLRDCVHRYN